MNDEFINVAWLLLGEGAVDPVQARARRAVSTAYYALFHTLAQSNADVLVGAEAGSLPWVRIYRALDHRTANSVLERLAKSDASADLRGFAEAFRELQLRRHEADYDPVPFNLASANFLVLLATQAITRFKSLSRSERLDLATSLLFKNRP